MFLMEREVNAVDQPEDQEPEDNIDPVLFIKGGSSVGFFFYKLPEDTQEVLYEKITVRSSRVKAAEKGPALTALVCARRPNINLFLETWWYCSYRGAPS